ncbi:11127_t:CDS:2 [Ambispora leptoticha]|uniref:11127_t:CDS:1 n=1 Tax=Ambispora leptoticha TaxID=144679 RepID=A0A9N8VHD3_9GLOM|nr:11127_t:CDS:2 [Ambispora leptoticha]
MEDLRTLPSKDANAFSRFVPRETATVPKFATFLPTESTLPKSRDQIINSPRADVFFRYDYKSNNGRISTQKLVTGSPTGSFFEFHDNTSSALSSSSNSRSPSPTSHDISSNNSNKSKGKEKSLKRKKKLGILDSDLSSAEETEDKKILKESIEDTHKAWDAFNSVLNGNDPLTKTGKKKRKGKVSNNRMRGGRARKRVSE